MAPDGPENTNCFKLFWTILALDGPEYANFFNLFEAILDPDVPENTHVFQPFFGHWGPRCFEPVAADGAENTNVFDAVARHRTLPLLH